MHEIRMRRKFVVHEIRAIDANFVFLKEFEFHRRKFTRATGVPLPEGFSLFCSRKARFRWCEIRVVRTHVCDTKFARDFV